MVWVDRTGEVSPLSSSLAGAHGQRFSPDGKRLVYKKENNIWLYELERESELRLTDGEQGEWWPLWTPDSARVGFNPNVEGDWDLYWKSVDGGSVELLAKTDYAPQPQTWSPDGKELIFTQGPHPEYGVDIWILPFEGDCTSRPLIQTRYNEFHPVLSRDGKWLAYASDEMGKWEVFVRPYPSLDSVTRISLDGGAEPLWSRDGTELFYRDETGDKMFAASITTDPELKVGEPELLFEGNYFLCSYWGRVYDISLDGNQFLMVSETEQELDPRHYNVVLNWFEELKQLVPSE
jgi:serine/threonine-protein kinase